MDFWRRYLLKPQVRTSALLEDIRATVIQMNSVRRWFDTESDADMIEACVYQLESLEARYRHLIKLAKEQGLSCSAFTGEPDEQQTA